MNKNAEAFGKSEVPFTVWQILPLLLVMISASITLCLNLYSSIAGGFVTIDHLVVSLYMLQIYVVIDEMIQAVMRHKFKHFRNTKTTTKEYPKRVTAPKTAIILTLNGYP